MASDLSRPSPRYLATLLDVGACSGLTDSQLLERFATHRGEAGELAFAALIDRHGPMVLRACRSILRDDHDAMDAFQATFLVLVRKRGSLWVRDSLGPWLHRVACRAAGRSKADAARRRAFERPTAAFVSAYTPDRDRDDLAATLNDEVNRLPDRYRTPILLCHMEGHTCEEAARLMGCPVGTVASRLSRGRDRLRTMLSRRGLVFGAAAIGEALSYDAAGAAVPPALLSSTTRIATSTIAGSVPDAAITTAIISLAQGTMKAMLLAKLKLAIAVLLPVCTLAAGALVAARQISGQRPNGEPAKQDGLAAPANGADIPVVTQHADDRPRAANAGQGPTINGEIVMFGKGKLDAPDIHQIRLLDPDDGNARTIAEFLGHAWIGRISPDGRRIAFLLPPLNIHGHEGINLWVMNADGQNREMVVENAGGAIGMAVTCWSPDGKQVAFHRQDKPSNIENYVVDLEKRTLARLELAGNELVSSWSPDDTDWLTGTLGVPPNPDPKQFQIYRVKKDGSRRVRVGEPNTGNIDAHFSPDGRRIAYLTGAPRPAEGRRPQVRIVDRDGGRSIPILEADPGASLSSPCWSPDGKRIAVISVVAGDTAVLVVDVDNGGHARRITPPPTDQIKEMSAITIDW
jgi:RNA polymerase sigma factor (sigma-70 family)